MSLTNNSRNIANLLRYQPLDPIPPRRNSNQPPNSVNQSSLPRVQTQIQNQIPLQQVFTPDDANQKRPVRRRTPLSSGGNNQGNIPPYRLTNRQDDAQIQSIKVRLDQIVRYYDQKQTHLENKVMVRLNQLQNFVMKEVPKIDNTAMVTSDIVGFKQIIKQVRRQQQYQNQEINTLKVLFNQKNNNQNSIINSNKDKEKMTVLFMEVVRLGDTVQKMTDGMNTVSRNYQSKIQELQHKLSNADKNLAIMSQRNTTGSQVLNELGQKVMNRLQTAQSNLLILGKEQVKDKQAMSRLASQNERIGEDLQALLRNMQGDFQNRLDNRISQTVNRLMFEHEQRVKAQQQIRKNLDLRERINQQKQMSQKIQFKSQYDKMDNLVRNQFMKKDQTIRALNNYMEEQFRNMMKQLQNQGIKRKQQQTAFRSEIKRVQQNFRKEYDIYKNHQSDLVQKITDMIKAQIQVRLSSQLDLKKLTSDIANQIVSDMNNVKQAISNSNRKLNLAIKQVSNQSAQRSGQLSHYIDQQVKKVVDVVTEKYSKMKSVFTKLAQQFKSHLQNTQTNRRNIQTRVSALQDDFNKLRSQINTQIQQFYTDFQARLKEQKEYVQTFVFKKNNDLSIRVNKLQQSTTQYFDLLKTGIEDNKDQLSNKLKQLQNNKGGSQNDEQLKQLRTNLFNIRQLAQTIKQQNQDSVKQLKNDIKTIEAKSKSQSNQTKVQLQEKMNKTNDRINQLEQNLGQVTKNVNNLRVDSGSDNTISTQRLKKLTNQLDSLTQKIKDVEEKSMEANGRNGDDIIRMGSDITVLRGSIGALEEDIKKLSGN